MDNKVLTVLIPVYNTEKYIKRCLDSVLLKEISQFIEVLIVSDGSKDNSIKIAKKYLKEFPDALKIIEKENGGHGSTINVGIQNAKGKYFKVLDSDDWFDSYNFIKLVEKLKLEQSDLVVTNYRQEHTYSGKSVFLQYKDLEDAKKYKFDSFDLEKLDGEYFVMATSTYKTSILKKAGVKLMEKTFYVDMQYNLMPITEVNNFTYYDLDIYRYFIGRPEQSVNVQSFVKNKNDHDKVLRFMVSFYEKNKEKMSENKKMYIKTIINYTLFTHYTIFCKYDKGGKKTYQQIKEFDQFLKDTSLELYEISNRMSFTKVFRKTNFWFVKHMKKTFLKIYGILSVIGG